MFILRQSTRRWMSSTAPPPGAYVSKPFFINMSSPQAAAPINQEKRVRNNLIVEKAKNSNAPANSHKHLFDQIQSASNTLADLERVLERTPEHEFNAIHTSMALVALAKCRSKNIELVEKLAQITQEMGKLRPRELAMCCYGLANGGWVRRIPEFLTEQANSLNNPSIVMPQSLSNLAWAFASLKQRAPQFIEFASKFVLERADFDDFTALDLSNLVWGMCLLRAEPPVLAKLLEEIGASRRTEKFPTRPTANVLWVMAKLEKLDPALQYVFFSFSLYTLTCIYYNSKQVLGFWSGEWKKKWAAKQQKEL